MTPRFDGKVAIVTGAGCVGPGWGNGRAIAVRLAEEGAQVFAVDRDPARLAETVRAAGEARRRRSALPCDVTDRRSGGGDGRRLRGSASAASTSWSTTSAARRPAVRSR